MPYRQLEGFTRALNRLIPKLPSSDYSWIRRRVLMLNISLYDSIRESDGSIVIAVDSSSISVHKCGGWVERIYGRKKRYIKIHRSDRAYHFHIRKSHSACNATFSLATKFSTKYFSTK
jgi:hypothetical protein